MAKFQIKSPSGTVLYEGTPSYTGTYMKPGTLTFRRICSPTPIDFVVGCYVDYSYYGSSGHTQQRTGLRYYLYSLPQVKRQARNGKSGESFIYDSVTFYEATKLLDFVPFRDMVIADNKVHFSTRESWSTYENVAGIARRIQACFDVFYPDTFEIIVASGTGVTPELAALMAEEREFSISGETLLGGLEKIYEVWPEVGWVFVASTLQIERDKVIIGGAGLVGTAQDYLYGKGKGLKTLQRNLANEGDIANRIYAYGSTKNLPPRYYNGKDIYCADSVDIQNLMIPISEWGEEGDKPSARLAYLEDTDSQENNGIRPKVVYFDGNNDNEDIYPTIKGLTVGDIRDYIDGGGVVDYPPGEQFTDELLLGTVLNVFPNPSDRYEQYFDSGLVGIGGKAYCFRKLQDINYSATINMSGGARPKVGNIAVIYTDPIGSFANKVRLFIDFSDIKLSFAYQESNPSGKLQIKFWEGDVEDPLGAVVDSTTIDLMEDPGSPNVLTLPSNIGEIESNVINLAASSVISVQINYELYGSPGGSSVSASMTGQLAIGCNKELLKNFEVHIPPFGYDLKDMVSTEGEIRIAMISGACAGREFRVTNTRVNTAGTGTAAGSSNSWYLTLERQYDESLSQYFPNNDYPVEADDTFVILGIAMPEFYITAAEQRLLAAAQDYLDYYKKEIWQYLPEIDSKFMVENRRRILPAQYMILIDYNLVDGDVSTLSYFVESGGGYFLAESGQKIIVDQSGFAVSVLVDSVTIDEGAGALPSYKVTLRDRKRRKK